MFFFPILLFLSLFVCNGTTVAGNDSGVDLTITDFGARTDLYNNAEAIQKAIDQCAATGGGIVNIPQGVFYTGTVYLKDRVHIRLHPEAVLKGVPDTVAYSTVNVPYQTEWGLIAGVNATGWALIAGVNVRNASITGGGTLNGHGDHANFQFGNARGPRPNIVWLTGCSDILIKDVSLINSASWTLRLDICDGIRINNIKILSHGNWNCDGIDINSRNVVISDCIIDCDDDAICFKSHVAGYVVENVTITNCIVASNCNAIKFGTGSFGGFRNIAISNCVIRKATANNIWDWKNMIRGITADTTVISGIALEVVDGGFMDRVVISNISMHDVQTPVFIRLGNRKGVGTLKNVIISGVTARSESLITSSITGIPGHHVENITIRDVFFEYAGGGTEEDAAIIVPERISNYPENRMFGDALPAYGLYVRHVKNLTLENFQCVTRHPDARPVFIFDDVHNVWLNNFQATVPTDNAPIVRLIESSDVVISGFRSQQTVPLFLKAEGQSSKNIDIRSNDFSKIRNKSMLPNGNCSF